MFRLLMKASATDYCTVFLFEKFSILSFITHCADRSKKVGNASLG